MENAKSKVNKSAFDEPLTYTVYECKKCKARDTDTSKNPPLVLHCGQCRSGQGQEVKDMLALGTGMHPISSTEVS